MIELKNATIIRNGKTLINNASISLHIGQKVGLTGNNGVGKSTFFALILGEHTQDGGDFFMPSGWQIAHMAQEVESVGQTAIDYVLSGDQRWYQLNAKMTDMTQMLPDDIVKLYEEFDNIDGYRTRSRAAEILSGLGFKDSEHERAVAEFSGGWRMRLNLARTLIYRAQVLLLDEPTNHLDLDAILWLEEYLCAYEGLVVVVSHDQAFLDAVVGQILHIENRQMTLYTGNYSQFVRTRAERLAQAQIAYEKQQATRVHLEDFIRRFKAKASKAKQAQSRVKQLERMALLSPVMVDNPFSFAFYPPPAMSSPLIKLSDAVIGYPSDDGEEGVIIKQMTMQITPETRLGLLGANGAGKSTLIKALVGEIALLGGERLAAESLRLGYFNQHQMDSLDLSATPMILLRRIAGQTSDTLLRAFLGSFDFRGDKTDTQVSLLSGGERARLTLALIVWSRPNVLVLDEPTNHLDLQMRDALSLALQDFEGALVLVSHDRELILTVCDELMLVGQTQAVEFTGDMSDYAHHLKKMRELRQKQPQPPDNLSTNNPSKEDVRKKNAENRQKTASLKKQLATQEAQLQKLNQEATTIERQLADNALYAEDNKSDLLALLDKQTAINAQIEASEEALLILMESLEALENEHS